MRVSLSRWAISAAENMIGDVQRRERRDALHGVRPVGSLMTSCRSTHQRVLQRETPGVRQVANSCGAMNHGPMRRDE